MGFQQQQYAFTAHIRDPDNVPAPAGIEDRRMRIYRELFFNNVNGFLADSMPVLHKIIAPEAWQSLVRDFFIGHQSHSPYFLDIPREFINYLDTERGEHPEDPAFLRELAHYEWVELALSVLDEPVSDTGELGSDDDLLDRHWQVSPLAWPLSYRFPVHRIGPDNLPDIAPEQPTQLVVYRDHDDKIRFLELNPVSARLLSLLTEHTDNPGYCAGDALGQIVQELQHPAPANVIRGGEQLLNDWRARGIILSRSHP